MNPLSSRSAPVVFLFTYCNGDDKETGSIKTVHLLINIGYLISGVVDEV